jgi:hypothetical protein
MMPLNDNTPNDENIISVKSFIKIMIKYQLVFDCASALLTIKDRMVDMANANRLPTAEENEAAQGLLPALLFMSEECPKFFQDIKNAVDKPQSEELN